MAVRNEVVNKWKISLKAQKWQNIYFQHVPARDSACTSHCFAPHVLQDLTTNPQNAVPVADLAAVKMSTTG